LPFDKLWEQYNRVIKDSGVIVLFGNEPFSSALRMSNIKSYKYDWKWRKTKPSGHLNAKKQPMRKFEDVMVFYKKQCIYNPQGLIEGEFNNNRKWRKNGVNNDHTYGQETEIGVSKFTNYPNNELEFSNKNNNLMHPTQKPVELFEYLIKTYTNEGELVLDNTAGSGTTAIACLNTNRQFIVMEKEQKYYDIILKRVGDRKQLLIE
jgi:site-specific DNA-methyltransferase (adenine-specific)